MALSIFLDAYIFARGRLPFDFYYYYIIYLVFIVRYISKLRTFKLFESWLFISFLILITGSFIASYSYELLGLGLVKQIIGLLFTSAAYYAFFRFNDFNLQKVFDLYLKVAVWVAALGIFEEFGKLAGLHFLFNHYKTVKLGFHRVWSIMGEPYFLAVVLIPALVYCGLKVFGNRGWRDPKLFRKFAILFTCTIFTFSSAGYMAIGILIVLGAYLKGFFSFSKGRIVLLPFILIGLVSLFNYVKENFWEFRTKITQTYVAFVSDEISTKDLDEMNSSTFALYSNYRIAQMSFNRNPMLGSGLGSHARNYDIMFTEQFDPKYLERFGELNKYDANSLFIRLLSETGLLGLGMFFFFIFRFRLRRKHINIPELSNWVIMNNGILILFIVRLVRTGNYVGNGFFFFFLLYYYTYSHVKKYYRNRNRNLALNES